MNLVPAFAPTELLLDAAHDYAARGWPVFPAPPGTKKGYKKGEDHGGNRWGCTTDPQKIAADWSRWPHANVGIACGADSGLFVVDADTVEGHGVDGVGALAELIAQHGALPATVEALSPSGSRHFYFTWPDGFDIRNSEGRIAPGIDVRGEGGMVIAPPSIKPGHSLPYRWIRPPGVFELAACPGWLLRLCVAKEAPRKQVSGPDLRVISSDADEQVLGWLYTRPNTLSRADWVRLCLALKGPFGQRARDAWLSFSNRYDGEIRAGEAERQWETANPDGRVELGTAIHLLGGFERTEPARRWSASPGEGGDPGDAETEEAAEAAEAAEADEDSAFVRPTIRVRAGELHLMADEAEAALIAGKAPLFVRGGLVRPIVDDVPAAHGRRTRVARLTEVDAATMLDHLSRCADWVKFNARKKSMVAADPPKDLAPIILSRDGEWRFRKLLGVITTPTLRPDGTILSQAGYDRATQLLLLDPPAMPAIANQPTRRDAELALAALDSLLAEFPFVDGPSRSVALSGLITPVVRGALSVAPLHASTAPSPGSGKSYIIDLVAAVSTGQRAPVISAGQKEEETEKRIAAAVISGQPIISVDNVNGQLGGDALCQLIERPLVLVRPLGASKLIRIENNSTWFATGNNIQLVGDMTRRVIMCSLDPNMERPELRSFRARPFDLVLANRGKYIAAALTIARAYIAAGCPEELPALASFEEWSRIVRSALVWLGRDDPVGTMEAARAEDPVISSLREVFHAWHTAVVSAPRTAGKIKDAAEECGLGGDRLRSDLHRALNEVADDKRGGIDVKRLGKWLGRHKGRIVDGLKLRDHDDAHCKQKVWSIVRV